MKKIGIFVGVALLLLAITLTWWIEREIMAGAEPQRSLLGWEPPEMICDPESVELRRRLMRWYNLNLWADSPEVGFQDAYITMVPPSTGLLGYVELEGGVYLPIYPDGYQRAEAAGFAHTMESGFPAVGMGCYSVLAWTGGAEIGDDWLLEGDVLWICILDQMQAYRVDSVVHAEPDILGREGAEMCALTLPGGSGEDVWVLCVAVNEAGLNKAMGSK